MEDREAEPQQANKLLLLTELVRMLQTSTQQATTAQEIYSQETEEEQPQMEVAETATAEPEAEQEEAGQMRGPGEGNAAAVTPAAADGR